MKKYKIGYTQGTYDLFHVGHLNLLENAKKQCDYLIVGVNDDSLVFEYKHKIPTVSVKDRMRIVGALSIVDQVVLADTLDKVVMLNKYKYDALFIGDDWKNNARWIETENQLSKFGVPVIFLPHTDGISTTLLNEKIASQKVNNNGE